MFKFIFGGVIIILANESIVTRSFSINDDFKSKRLLKGTFNHVGNLSLKIYYTCHEMTDFSVYQKSQFSVQPILATEIDRIKYYL